MNERIRELVKSAEVAYEQESILLSLVIEKFAELIVRESIVDFYRRYLDLESEEDITEQVNRYVKDNFGVER
jgi:hypothetical protein